MRPPFLATRIVMGMSAAVVLWITLNMFGSSILRLEAISTSIALDLLGINHLRVGDTIYIRSMGETIGFRIEWHCSGFITYTLLLIILFVVPLNIKRKMYWTLLGFLVIYLVNILRIMLIILIAKARSVEEALAIHSFMGPLMLVSTLVYLSLETLWDTLRYTRATRR